MPFFLSMKSVRLPVQRILYRRTRSIVGDSEAGSLMLAINQAVDRVRFSAIDDEHVAHLANKIVRKELDKYAITYNGYKEWRAVNPLIFTAVVDDADSLIGFFDVFPLTAKAGHALLEGALTERSMTAADLVPRRYVAEATHIHVATILLNPRQKTFQPIVAKEVLLLKLREFLQTHYEPFESRTFTAYAQTRAGEVLLRRCGFSVAVVAEENRDRWPLYVLHAGAGTAAASRFERADARRAMRVWIEEWDPRIHKVERTLRHVIANALENNGKLLPEAVSQRINDRLVQMMKKNPAMGGPHFDQMPFRLEYCDLRELQDTILNRSLWPRFTATFKNQESLSAKFGQLADLRNAVRHSRSINQIVLREGEAAVLWFEAVLECG